MAVRLYRLAYYFILLAIAIGQLIWLPAPLFNNLAIEWIAVIDILYYSLLLIPLLFISGTVITIKQHRDDDKFTKRYMLIAVLIIMFGLYTSERIIQMDWVVAIIGLMVLMVFVYIFHLSFSKKLAVISIKKTFLKLTVYVILLACLICPIPYNVKHPFFTFSLDRYAQIESIAQSTYQTSTTDGKIEGVLVVDRPAFIIDILYSKWFKHIELERRTKSDLSIAEQYTQVVSQKLSSNSIAEAYAWQIETDEKAIQPVGVHVVAVIDGSTSDGRLQAGDVIVGIDGETIRTLNDLSSTLNHVKVGQSIAIHIMNITGQQKKVELVVKGAEDNAEKAFLGIYIEQAVKLDEPLQVNYEEHIAHFGGPSHGAMLTLSLMNQLNEGKLLGALHVAGTGTIELDGSIGMVGGVKQKAYAVSRTKADVFFVPEAAFDEAQKSAPNLNIVSVKHISDILRWLTQQQKA